MAEYPKTLFHPHRAGVVATVDNAKQENEWHDAGWLKSPPKAKDTVPADQKVTTTK